MAEGCPRYRYTEDKKNGQSLYMGVNPGPNWNTEDLWLKIISRDGTGTGGNGCLIEAKQEGTCPGCLLVLEKDVRKCPPGAVSF